MNVLKSQTKEKRTLRLPPIALALSSAVVIGLIVGINAVPTSHAETPTPLTAAPWVGYADLIEDIMPSVVTVTTGIDPNTDFDEEDPRSFRDFGERGMSEEDMQRFMERFFNKPGAPMLPHTPSPHRRGPIAGSGSGFIVGADGLIVTNHHVIDHAAEVTVTLNDGREFDAEFVGADPDTDLALLRVEADEALPVATFANADDVRVGDAVIAIGNPFGLGGTVTSGIVSAKAREIGAGRYDDFLQIDAPINRGNSGGPTFNLRGEVIGVNTAIHSPTGGNVGIGFAIPADLTQKIVADLSDDGMVERGWLGVHIQALDDDLADGLGLDEAKGALVARVTEDGPAATHGIEQGDVILDFAGTKIDHLRDLTRAVADMKPGSEAEIRVWRDGAETDLTVKIDQMPSAQQMAAIDSEDEAEEDTTPKLGLALAMLDDQARQAMDLPDGLDGAMVTRVLPGSPAAEKGVREGDVIVEADHQAVTDPETVVNAVRAVAERGDEAILLLIKRGDQDRFIAVRLDQA
ncbi:MAG: Do family serine endopeptidase [Geminicoccaceae bacterium]